MKNILNLMIISMLFFLIGCRSVKDVTEICKEKLGEEYVVKKDMFISSYDEFWGEENFLIEKTGGSYTPTLSEYVNGKKQKAGGPSIYGVLPQNTKFKIVKVYFAESFEDSYFIYGTNLNSTEYSKEKREIAIPDSYLEYFQGEKLIEKINGVDVHSIPQPHSDATKAPDDKVK